jgi:hypothetical protein
MKRFQVICLIDQKEKNHEIPKTSGVLGRWSFPRSMGF